MKADTEWILDVIGTWNRGYKEIAEALTDN